MQVLDLKIPSRVQEHLFTLLAWETPWVKQHPPPRLETRCANPSYLVRRRQHLVQAQG